MNNITDKIKSAPMGSTYMYIQTPLMIGGYGIAFRYSSSEAGRIQQMLDKCKEICPGPTDCITRAVQIEASVAAKMEDVNLGLVDAFYDKNEKQVVKLAIQAYKGYDYLKKNPVNDIKSLIEYWRVIEKNCRPGFDVEKLSLRMTDKQSSIVDMPNMKTPAEDLNTRLGMMFNFLNADTLVNAVVKFIYLSLIEPFNISNQRMAAMLFKHELGVDSLPIIRMLYWAFENYDRMFSQVSVSRAGIMDITEMIELILGYVRVSAETYIRAAKPITKVEQSVLTAMPLCEEVRRDKIESMCAMHQLVPALVMDKLMFGGYVVQEYKDYYVKIKDM